MKGIATALAACVAIAVTGCGDSGESATGSGEIRAESAVEASKRTQPDVKPSVGPPPRELAVEDLIEGSGKPVRKGMDVTIEYVGVRHESGEEYANSWEVDYPSVFEVGPREMIAGWEQGLLGMRVGGRRKLVIPVHLLGFGGPPSKEEIRSGSYNYEEGVVFVIDLLGVS